MVRVDDVLRQLQRHVVAHADARFGFHDHFATELGMAAHLELLLGGQRARLVEDAIGNADLADVVQRREAGEQIDPFAGQVVAVVGVTRERLGEQTRVLLRAA